VHRAGFSLANATRCAGVLLQFVLGRTVEEQTRPGPTEEIVAVTASPWPLLARGIQERHDAGATVADDFRYALGIILAGLSATRTV
jgi:TetR/AcrR family tetracycline transcriptional repressor